MAIRHETASPDEVGRAFVDAIVTKDRDALMGVLAPSVDFRGLTPSCPWEASDPQGVAEIVFGSWFEPADHVREVLVVTTGAVADRHRLAYRFVMDSDGVRCVVEQQGFFDTAGGRITRLSLVCSGFRPVEASTPD
ncbi:MAG: hypothetical protein ACXWXS_01280 [Actinomycetota bacterium]